MQPFDAVFLALVVMRFARRPHRWWLLSAAPLIAFAVRLAPLADFHLPTLALIAALLSAKSSPAAFLLMAPVYQDPLQAIFIAVLWTTLVVFFDALEERLDDDNIPSPIRGTPARLVVVGVLYHALFPMAFV